MTRTHADVGKLVKERRLQLKMSTPELARVAGVDPKTVRALESGERWPQDTSRAKIEKALGWAAGSLDDYAGGGQLRIIEKGPAVGKVSGRFVPADIRKLATEDALTSEQFRELFNRWSSLYVQSVQLEWEYSDARGISLSDARDELVATIFMASQAKDDRPWTPPWEDYPDGYEPWDESWWAVPGNRERFHYWQYGELGLPSEYRKKHPEYLTWPTNKPIKFDPDDPANYDLAAHPPMETEREKYERLHGDRGEENQDTE